MRIIYVSFIVILFLFAGNWWAGAFGLACKLPVYYTVGQFDERFGISETEARLALAEAEAVWEESLGRDDLFTYKEDAKLQVNFIYDERQRQAEETERARDSLETREEANTVLVELHRQLVAEYHSNEVSYEERRVAYENSLDAYNAEVERYNQEGGAPPDVYKDLEKKRVQLETERIELNDLGDKLNDLSERINEIGEKGNELIGEYNERVRQFNDTFVHDEEYTQGDYRSRQINVYTFTDHRDLVLVLAHELGHSLAISHVENPSSIMYYLMGGQTSPPALTDEDLAGFTSACEQGVVGRLLAIPRMLYNTLIN
ncbi:hypothetical protein A2837_02620 [Candidatus Kaiserbacteria bacterium RIFCSPHIGHO2_01_FULL_46_22]|uniref:Peptidase M10 metallopeptidase domain-containing protein n=1 Tax=Candidatus Kaiserbacteria bacterium RIFCSPHIGHO2_01_FULL_46_22 TaxID=1798475 RepID=A0A1F6BWQ2_9BACT|nr:MAG: hypothetical protein A2837_02620 [Candidatus Kaiserbacteria bacterium RIFCSPHIGHO2_01_FULL_46_22]